MKRSIFLILMMILAVFFTSISSGAWNEDDFNSNDLEQLNLIEPESNLKEINEKLNKIETTKNDDLKVKQTKEKVTQELAILGTDIDTEMNKMLENYKLIFASENEVKKKEDVQNIIVILEYLITSKSILSN